MVLYGKDALKARLSNTAAKGRLSHALMFSGNTGSGRRTMARYTAQLFLCENGGCGNCPTCRNIEKNCHPDVIFVKKSLPDEKYAAAPFREVLRDTVIRPNNGDLKIYVFEDCDDMQTVLHNALLKLIEEPLPHLRFIFTAENTAVVPETVMSRVTEYEVPDTTIPECTRALVDDGVPSDKAAELAELFSGNIGRCKALLADSDKDNPAKAELAVIDSAKQAAFALANRDMLGTAAALSQQTNRAAYSETFRVFSHIIRDALAVKNSAEAEYLAKDLSRRIADAYSEKQLVAMLETAFEIEQNANYNLNLPLTTAYFMSQAMK